MNRKKKTITQKILFNREAYYSDIRSAEILRVAKQMAVESHKKAEEAQKAYIAQHRRQRG